MLGPSIFLRRLRLRAGVGLAPVAIADSALALEGVDRVFEAALLTALHELRDVQLRLRARRTIASGARVA